MRNKKLEKYVKRYTGVSLKVITQKWFWGGYGAKYQSKGILYIREDLLNFKPLIWHEMGHLMDGAEDWVENEVKAQLAVFKKLKDLGYEKIYRDSLMWVTVRWGNQNNENNRNYAKARKRILAAIIQNPKKYAFFD